MGGARVAGPGKKLGRPPGGKVKKPVSFSLDKLTIQRLDFIAGQYGLSKSESVKKLIDGYFIKL
jgi:hypothetical protein